MHTSVLFEVPVSGGVLHTTQVVGLREGCLQDEDQEAEGDGNGL